MHFTIIAFSPSSDVAERSSNGSKPPNFRIEKEKKNDENDCAEQTKYTAHSHSFIQNSIPKYFDLWLFRSLASREYAEICAWNACCERVVEMERDDVCAIQ